MPFSVGQTVGDYQVIEILGSGGMGTVYKVRHLISDRLEAIKLVLPELTENPDLLERFTREIKIQARLCHPNIAALHNALRIQNQMLMVMEFVEGRSLHSVMRQAVMEPLIAIDIVSQILSALEYAHAQGVVHRDIKPANVMLSTGGVVKLMDFGIARSFADETSLTQTGAAVGSVYYMSPEQVEGLPVDARADLYSVGILLYEMVTGVRAVAGDSSYSVMNGHLKSVPRAPSAVNSGVPEALSLCILKAIEKSRENRFQSALSFAESLTAVRSRMLAGGIKRPELQATLMAMTPPRSPVAMPTPTPPATGEAFASFTKVQFDPERLEKLTRELASFVGPMAKVLVTRAAKRAQTWKQLYDVLAPEVPEGAERKQFLSKRP